MFITIIVRIIGILGSVALLISAIVMLIKNKKSKKRIFGAVVVFLVALIIPYLMFFHGKYRKNDLKLSETVPEVVTLIEKLDLRYDVKPNTIEFNGEIFELEGGEEAFPNFNLLAKYEARTDDAYVMIDVCIGEKPIDKDLFISRAFLAASAQDDPDKVSAKMESGENDGCLWTASPLIEYDTSTLNVHTGVYDGTFFISKDNIIYICSYSYPTKAPSFLIAFTNLTPKKRTAVDLISMFLDVENMYGEIG
jgi:hypothetical protein